MSLINDALKKAQRDRTGDGAKPPADANPPPGSPPPASAHAASAAPSSGFKAWPIVAIVALVVVGVLGWRLLAPSSEKPAEVAATLPTLPAEQPAVAPVETPKPAPADAGVHSETSKPSESAPAPGVAAPAAQNPAPSSDTTVAQNPTRQESEPPPAIVAKVEPPKTEPQQPVVTVSIPSASAQTPPASTPRDLPATAITIPEGSSNAASTPMISLRQQDPRILAYLDAVVVNGIRPSPDDPKVLMNNRVFRVRDVVDRELNLRLTGIAPQRLTFEDERGMEYVKTF